MSDIFKKLDELHKSKQFIVKIKSSKDGIYDVFAINQYAPLETEYASCNDKSLEYAIDSVINQLKTKEEARHVKKS